MTPEPIAPEGGWPKGLTVLDRCTMVFSTGRKINTNSGIIGIDAKGNIFEGYDGELTVRDDVLNADGLNRIERRELADYMIDLWRMFKENAEFVPE
jgi:hypothetical protein